MSSPWLKWRGVLVTLLMAATTVSSALADDETKFSALYIFEAAAPGTFTVLSGPNRTPGRCWVPGMLFTG